VSYASFAFWIFFFAVLAPYWRLGHRAQNRWMLAASYVFYGFWDYRFLYLILISTVIDYIGGLGVAGVQLSRAKLRRLGAGMVAASAILTSHVGWAAVWRGLVGGDAATIVSALPRHLADFAVPLGTLAAVVVYGRALPTLYALPEERRRKAFLTISMVANLAILAFFKYFDFFASGLTNLLGALGLHARVGTLGLILPAGISFYTFQAMSYTIDIYRKQCEPTDDFLDFALFVCFFPHLVAGPIMRAHTLLPQVLRPRKLTLEAAREGALLIAIGLAKKIVIADNMALVANSVFFRFEDGTAAGVTGPEALVGLYAFALQIYGDFSGYSSIARGLSKFFGYDLVINFDLPYFAQSPSDFWKRWHISLSSWLRDYLYIPLGGNRHGVVKQYRNLVITMLLGGLWHGASWTFVAWGLYHGILLTVFRVLGISDEVRGAGAGATARRVLRVVVMFHLTCLGWLLFRAATFRAAAAMFARIVTDFHVTPKTIAGLLYIALLAGPLTLLEAYMRGERRTGRLLDGSLAVRATAYAYLVTLMLIFHAEQPVEFIYFQF
jgi:alginate O-acetyltransferase complex protein AlgI